MGVLYCLTFSNGKKYLGLTTTSPSRRFGRHCAAAKDPKRQSRVYKAWRKYGEPKFSILAVLPNELLAETERRAISVFNTKIPNGYNQSDGGEGTFGAAVSAETRKKISEKSKGRKASEEAKEKMAAAKRGKHLSEEQKLKISEALKGREKSFETRERLKKANTGKSHSVETRAKISKNRKGVKMPAEAVARVADKNRGQRRSPEVREKMRVAALLRHATARARIDEAVK